MMQQVYNIFSPRDKNSWKSRLRTRFSCKNNLQPTDNPSEEVVGPTSFWPLEATFGSPVAGRRLIVDPPVAGRRLIVGPTVAKVDVGPTLAHRWLNSSG